VKFSRRIVAEGFEYKKFHPEYFQLRSDIAEATIHFVMSVRPSASLSASMEQLDFHWRDFHEI
jgi:hypothetical protein